jgi:hypothetical protein
MKRIHGFPYQEVKFNKKGHILDANEVNALIDSIETESVTDLICISHGWNNDMDEARALYDKFLAQLREVLHAGSAGGLSDRKLAVMAILWPSKKFADDELKPGGAASLGEISEDVLINQLNLLKGAFDAEDADTLLTDAIKLVPKLEDKRTARDEFGAIVKTLLGDISADEEAKEEIPQAFFNLSGSELIDNLSAPALLEPPPETSDSGEGGTAGLFGFGGILSGARQLLNFTTYWQMKKRAGIVGAGGVHDVLQQLHSRFSDLRLHLVGHSFGGRLVTAAAASGADVKISSMTLLQAAFSHNGFAKNFKKYRDGYFRRVVTEQRVKGPVLITHTANDKAVGVAYPLASRLSRDDSSGLGDKNDPFGGIGRNGAQHTPETKESQLLTAGSNYDFHGGVLYNLQADRFIRGHSDITNTAVAHAVAMAIATT